MYKITLALDFGKNTYYIEKCFKLKFLSIKFHTKKSVGACVYLPQECNYGAPKISLKYYIVLKRESRFNLELETAKNTHYIKKCLK